MDLCLMMHTYQEKEPSLYMLSVLQGITEEIWQKDHFHRYGARWYIMMVLVNG
jgi:hypothetical protein